MFIVFVFINYPVFKMKEVNNLYINNIHKDCIFFQEVLLLEAQVTAATGNRLKNGGTHHSAKRNRSADEKGMLAAYSRPADFTRTEHFNELVEYVRS